MSAEACWHCQDTNKCLCAFCGSMVMGGEWVAGKCCFCAGRKAFEAIRPRLEAENIDPRDRKHWTRDLDGHMLFDPFGDFRRAASAKTAKPVNDGKERAISTDDDGYDYTAAGVDVPPAAKKGRKKK